MGHKQFPEQQKEVFPALALSWPCWLSIIEFSTDPHIDHQKREARHHAKGTDRATKFPLDGLRCKIAVGNSLRVLFLVTLSRHGFD